MYFQWLAWKGSKRYVDHGGHRRASLWCFSRWLSVTDNVELFPWSWNHRNKTILFVRPHVFPFMREEYKGGKKHISLPFLKKLNQSILLFPPLFCLELCLYIQALCVQYGDPIEEKQWSNQDLVANCTSFMCSLCLYVSQFMFSPLV